MRFKINYGGKPTYNPKDFSRGKFECKAVFRTKKGMPVVALFLGQMSDPGDIIGLPDKEDEHTIFRPPYWFPTDNKPVVLFLDELNRARPEVLQTIMDLALNRKIAGRQLPKGSRIISAVNEGDEYQLTDLDPALVSRFNVYRFCPTVQEWLLWAEKNGIDKRITGFIADQPAWLDGVEGISQHADWGLEKTPDRRAWHRVSDIINASSELTLLHSKAVSGIVGVPAAARFMDYASSNGTVSGTDVLLNFDNVKKTISTYRIHQLSAVSESVMRTLETYTLSEEQLSTAARNLQQYIAMLNNQTQKEAIAHFASCFNSSNYPNAVSFIICNAAEVYETMMNYIEKL